MHKKLYSAFYKNAEIKLHYYEIKNDLQPIVMIHAQGVDSTSYANVFKALSKKYHVYAVDCYGHGKSLHDAEKYNIKDISEAISQFIREVVKDKVVLVGHSSGGLIAAYIAATTELCSKLYLEDPPFFASQGERRFQTFNYVDLSTICHRFNNQLDEKDFVLYYFSNQYAWNFFPEKSREKIKEKLTAAAKRYREKHPDKNLKVPFWPKAALSGFCGMNDYDPLFGEAFYCDSFHSDIPHKEILRNIQCETVFMKAKTNKNDDGLLLAALDEEDLEQVLQLNPNCSSVRFDCGHGIHIEKEKEFLRVLILQKSLQRK
ncbi:alpha/beta hydrolase [Acetivibrio cellulolyticus]|uniref:alpha/beta hydrolase n=1 Tax=Acetivibrio cellulolyticus TaxID=35830 RepID=UPI0001E30159|nr:alpha/beta hydrolase [Acetivibrio cellulolyticus]